MKGASNIAASGVPCAAFLVLIMTAMPAGAQSSLPPAVDAFVASASALAKAATERVDLGRATARLNLIRREVTDKVLAARADEPIRLAVNQDVLLCEIRVNNVEVAVRRNYIQTVAAKIEEVGKPSKIDNLSSAIGSLFAGQSLDIQAGIPSAKELEDAKKKVRERCLADVRDFDLTYYGRDITPPTAHKGVPAPAAAPFFAAVGAVIETIVNIITPVVVEGAKIVDEEARRRTVIAFLKNETNIKTIRESGLALATEVSAFTWNKRLRLAGSFSERAAVLRASPVDLSKGDSCKKYLAAGQPTNDAKTSLTDDFILCWRAAWEQVESNVAALLKVAEEYDRLADAGDTDNAHQAFRPLADSLQAITTTDETDLKRFWGWATRLLAFAQKVETALSKESREKIEKAIDDLVKAI